MIATIGLLDATEGREVLRHERRLACNIERVWNAIAQPSQLNRWFPDHVELDPWVGGQMSFVARNGDARALEGEVSLLDPGRLFEFTWDEDVLRIELRQESNGCCLTLTHAFDVPRRLDRESVDWHRRLDLLQQSLGDSSCGLASALRGVSRFSSW